MFLFQIHGRPFILQITCYTGILVYAKRQLLDRKLRGILQLMTELPVEIIQFLDLQSWLHYFILIQQIFIKYLHDQKLL